MVIFILLYEILKQKIMKYFFCLFILKKILNT